jgi:hypothetical protein
MFIDIFIPKSIYKEAARNNNFQLTEMSFDTGKFHVPKKNINSKR